MTMGRKTVNHKKGRPVPHISAITIGQQRLRSMGYVAPDGSIVGEGDGVWVAKVTKGGEPHTRWLTFQAGRIEVHKERPSKRSSGGRPWANVGAFVEAMK